MYNSSFARIWVHVLCRFVTCNFVCTIHWITWSWGQNRLTGAVQQLYSSTISTYLPFFRFSGKGRYGTPLITDWYVFLCVFQRGYGNCVYGKPFVWSTVWAKTAYEFISKSDDAFRCVAPVSPVHIGATSFSRLLIGSQFSSIFFNLKENFSWKPL